MGGEVILWDFETAEQLRLVNAQQEVYGVVFSPDGKTAYAALRDGTLIVWNIDEKTLPELMEWIKANRYVRPLTSMERQQYDNTP
jgi:WD40 repeat protein